MIGRPYNKKSFPSLWEGLLQGSKVTTLFRDILKSQSPEERRVVKIPRPTRGASGIPALRHRHKRHRGRAELFVYTVPNKIGPYWIPGGWRAPDKMLMAGLKGGIWRRAPPPLWLPFDTDHLHTFLNSRFCTALRFLHHFLSLPGVILPGLRGDKKVMVEIEQTYGLAE